MLTKQDEKIIKNVVEDAIVNSLEDTIIPAMETMHQSLDGRMDGLDGRMDNLEGRLERVEGRLERVEQKLDRTYDATLVQGNKITDHEKRIGKLEKPRFIAAS